MKTYIFWNCNLCSFSSFIILSIVSNVIWHIVSHVTTTKAAIHAEYWPIIAAHIVVKCIITVAHIWIVADAIESIHQAAWAACIWTVKIVETHAAKAIVSELIKIWSIEVTATQWLLVWCPWIYEIITTIAISVICNKNRGEKMVELILEFDKSVKQMV